MTRKFRGFFRPVPTGRMNRATVSPTMSPAEVAAAEAYAVDDFDPDDFPDEVEDERLHSPSLPIVLFSAASGVAAGVIALFVSYKWLQWGVELSAGMATLALLFGLGISGAILSAAIGSRAAPVNILFSCGLILLAILFLGLCLLVGALFSTLFVRI